MLLMHFLLFFQQPIQDIDYLNAVIVTDGKAVQRQDDLGVLRYQIYKCLHLTDLRKDNVQYIHTKSSYSF